MSETVMPTVRTADTGARSPTSARGATGRPNSSAAARRPSGGPSLRTGDLYRARLGPARAEALEQMIPDAQGVGGDRQGRIHRRARAEEAAVDDIEVVHVVGPAVHV